MPFAVAKYGGTSWGNPPAQVGDGQLLAAANTLSNGMERLLKREVLLLLSAMPAYSIDSRLTRYRPCDRLG